MKQGLKALLILIIINAVSMTLTTLFFDPYYGGTIDGVVIPISIFGYLGWLYVNRRQKNKTR